MGDTFEFLMRMTVFAISFYFMAEFALLSKVDTSVGVAVLFAIVTGVLIYTVAHRSKYVVECQVCAKRMVK
jgi:uncharacterized integral membrane protein